jgi:hypothetical protein
MRFPLFLFAIGLLYVAPATAQSAYSADVLVVGGGTGGTAAAIQSARGGAKTILVCETPWLGGMLSAAGVGCTDGNHLLQSGLWQEFREKAYAHYGTRNLATGWVSNFNIEPHVADSIFKSMAVALPNLKVHYGSRLLAVSTKKTGGKGRMISGIKIEDAMGRAAVMNARVYVDATELGDLLAMAGCRYDVGLEPEDKSGEKGYGVVGSDGVIQDLTYAAVLKDFGTGADKTIPRPANYDPKEFDCSCNEKCADKSKLYSNVDAQKMLDYGRMPNKKYMINWPSNGNDYYTNIINRPYAERLKAMDSAKQKTLRFVYYIQTELGLKHYGLADDEYNTPDKLPYMPYHREGRRLKGLVRFTTADVLRRYETSKLYRTGIAVGDYPIDHHHRMYPGQMPDLHFVPIPSYALPAGAMLPKEVSNLVVCDKSISVSNIMNGTTRLQPVVLLTGQAAGMLAAMATSVGKAPSSVGVRTLQTALLQQKAWLAPLVDVPGTDKHWESIQKVSATGILRTKGVAQGWANKTYFMPDSTVGYAELASGLTNVYGIKNVQLDSSKAGAVTVADAGAAVQALSGKNLASEALWQSLNLGAWQPANAITRRQMAVLLDKALNPFARPVDWKGNYEQK